MRTSPAHRSQSSVVARLLVALLFVEASLARHSSVPSAASPQLRPSRSMVQPTDIIDSSRRQSGEDCLARRGQLSGMAFIHRAGRDSRASCKAIGCSDARARDESSSMKVNSVTTNALGSLESILSLRGGSSSNNAVQSVLKSILDSPSLPAPIKRILEMICQFIESLTGWKVLPQAEKKKSKAKKSKPKEREVLVEEASVRPKKRSGTKRREEVAEVAVNAKKKRKSGEAETVSPETIETKATTKDDSPATASSTKTEAATPKKNAKPKRPDAASQKFLANKMKSSNPNYRIQRELKEFLSSPPPGLSVKISGKNVRLWVVTLSMPDNTIYAGETYKLRVQFPNDYPTSPPSVYFLPPTPRHEHVYTNGDICLSLLGKDWRPIMTAQSIAQAIMSILCGAQRKSLPMDNARHAGNKPGQKQDDWVYHDDNC